jgi:cytochrome c553
VYPSIAGQPASYVETQFRRWQAGVRRHDIADLMGSVARRMTDEDIRAVSAYVAGLAP